MLKDWVVAAMLVAAVASILALVITSMKSNLSRSRPELGLFDGRDSLIVDDRGDARPDKQYEATTVPEVKNYQDIVAAGVKKAGDDFLLTVLLAGDPNMNEKYETNYMWHIITPEHTYTVLLPNFAQDSGFAQKGWHVAVFDNTDNKYVIPLTQILGMPKDRVEFPLTASYIGSPTSFQYWVSVSVRVDTENLDGPPEYLMDYAP